MINFMPIDMNIVLDKQEVIDNFELLSIIMRKSFISNIEGEDKVLKSFRNHVSKNLPSDCKVEFLAKAGSGASSLEINSPEVKAAERALHDEWNISPKMVGCGGSIPIGDHFKSILGTNSLLVGFGLDDDKIHSPNEKYNLILNINFTFFML